MANFISQDWVQSCHAWLSSLIASRRGPPRTHPQESLAVLYRLRRVGLVTPLKDGLKFVAKEYVTAQDFDDPGVLVLSQFAGAADELEEAVIVNPYDIAGVSAAIKMAGKMPLDERRRRHEALFERLAGNTVHDWNMTLGFVSANAAFAFALALANQDLRAEMLDILARYQ